MDALAWCWPLLIRAADLMVTLCPATGSLTEMVMGHLQRHSCSSSVLMEETAEQVAATHRGFLFLAGHDPISGMVRRLKQERPVGTVPVVVLDMDPKDLLQMAAPNDQELVQALGADGADPPFGVGVRLGCLQGRSEYLAALGAEHITPRSTAGVAKCRRAG